MASDQTSPPADGRPESLSEQSADLHLPLIEAAGDSIAEAAAEQKPTWRGWIHAATVPIALVAGIVLICLADTLAGKIASAVFMLTSLLLFGISATYHRFDWKPRTRVLLKRLDHSNIFLLISGTYTPIGVLCLPPAKAVTLLSIVWASAVLGILFKVFWLGAPRWLYVLLYIAMGWGAIAYLVDIWNANATTAILVIVGGLAYTLGAVFYATKRPNPFPGRFGFHEIFHALTVVAFLCHWTGILVVALDPPMF